MRENTANAWLTHVQEVIRVARESSCLVDQERAVAAHESCDCAAST